MKLRNPVLREELRKFYGNGWTHREVRKYLEEHCQTSVSTRTLKRWKRGLADPCWIGPIAPFPPLPATKVTPAMLGRICAWRQRTGWGCVLLKHSLPYPLSPSTYRDIIKSNGLSRGSKIENTRIHWVKWQREHPDSLWQLDSWKLPNGHWVIDVIDDRSRFCPGIREVVHLTMSSVTAFLEDLIRIHGTPREILTDNGAEHGLTNKLSEFDQWCRRHHIEHIRSRIHKPTTAGKVERFHQTVQRELSHCDNDYELFRYRYNHIRPHMSLHGKTPAAIYFDLQIRIKMSEKQPSQRWG